MQSRKHPDAGPPQDRRHKTPARPRAEVLDLAERRYTGLVAAAETFLAESRSFGWPASLPALPALGLGLYRAGGDRSGCVTEARSLKEACHRLSGGDLRAARHAAG